MKSPLLLAALAIGVCGCSAPKDSGPTATGTPSNSRPAPPASLAAPPIESGIGVEMAFHPDDLKPFLERLDSVLKGVDERAAAIHDQIIRLQPKERTTIEVPVQYEGVPENLRITAEMGADKVSVVRFSLENPAALKEIERLMDQ